MVIKEKQEILKFLKNNEYDAFYEHIRYYRNKTDFLVKSLIGQATEPFNFKINRDDFFIIFYQKTGKLNYTLNLKYNFLIFFKNKLAFDKNKNIFLKSNGILDNLHKLLDSNNIIYNKCSEENLKILDNNIIFKGEKINPCNYLDSIYAYGSKTLFNKTKVNITKEEYLKENFRVCYKEAKLTKDGHLKSINEKFICYDLNSKNQLIHSLELGPIPLINSLFIYNYVESLGEGYKFYFPLNLKENFNLLTKHSRKLKEVFFYFTKLAIKKELIQKEIVKFEDLEITVDEFSKKINELLFCLVETVCKNKIIPKIERKELLREFSPKKPTLELIEVNGNWLSDKRETEQVIVPHGLVSLATYINGFFGDVIKISIKDFFVDFKNYHDFEEYIKINKIDIVGLRSVHLFKNSFIKIAKTIRSHGNSYIMAGGPITLYNPDKLISETDIDSCILGEGETTLKEFFINYLSNRDLRFIRGTVVKDKTKIIENPPRSLIKNLDNLPIPNYDKYIDINKYSNFLSYAYNKRKQGIIFSSRGCPYKCKFCHNQLGDSIRVKSAEKVFEEIYNFYKKDILDIYILDDNFNCNIERLKKLLNLIINSELKGNIRIYCVNGLRGDLLTKELIDLLVLAGTVWITVSIETPSQRLQKIIKKNMDINRIKENIKYIASKEIIVNYCFMVGFPEETEDEAYSILEFAKELPPFLIPMLFTLKIYPKTEYHKEYFLDENLVNNRDLSTPYHNFRHSKKKYIFDIYKKYFDNYFYDKDRLKYNISILKKIGYSKNETEELYKLLTSPKRYKSLIEGLINERWND